MTWPEIAGGLAGVAVTLGAIGTAMGWGYRRLREWIQRTAAAAERAADAVATSNGRTLGMVAEDTAAVVVEIRKLADANRVRLDALEARLDRHIITGHRGD